MASKDHTACDPCAAGSFEDGDGNACTACPADYSSNDPAGAAACDSCGAGSVANGAKTVCEPCAAGQYEDASAHTCSVCPAAKISAAGVSGIGACTACDTGEVTAAGQSVCETCAPGFYAAMPNRDACVACPSLEVAAYGTDDAPMLCSSGRAT